MALNLLVDAPAAYSPAQPPKNGEFFPTERAYSGLSAPVGGGRITHWILTEGHRLASAPEFFDELCWRLIGDGVPLWRASAHAPTLHPQIRGLGLRWWRDRRIVEEYRILHRSDASEDYRLSPIRRTVEDGVEYRCRLDGGALEFPLLEKIRDLGGTDYFALPLNRQNGRYPAIAWATDRRGGFRDADLAALRDINPAFAIDIDVRSLRRTSANLLDTYLGPQAGRRILAGQILRAEGDRLRAVIMISDMRNFTGLSDRLPGEAVIELLDDYFDAVVPPVQERRGEVLKFLGDGVLAIFPAEDSEDFAPASLRALEAAAQGLARVDAVNKRRGEQSLTEFRAGFGLHLGEMMFGNVGAADRLDFTVVGPAVNLASRIEGLTKRLLRPLLTSSVFAQTCPRPLVSLGYHAVRGLNAPEEVFALPE